MPSLQDIWFSSYDESIFYDATNEELVEACRKNHLKDSREIKRAVQVEQSMQGTYICAVAVRKNEDENRLLAVPVFGEPLSRECYDTVRDVFVVEGVDWVEVGSIPVNYTIRLGEETYGWQMDIPVPTSVIKRHLTKEQKHRLNCWKSRWNRKDYKIEYLQSLQVF